ncbi:hypothetical protein S7711_06316 [Stachybotrys chartarum IBT 7711]|uniref:Btz domain-containing protein n=1 Tax=Stachybotrys chartarum (strain CBS 109288 / IBT 7711) TaxID=1280523 RepID=A0A084B861_STACB|nr:hypothetical protein S7711_06316 [Stachybotrys chartarum IBT 7711]KFA47300.1 hypothetical protein S40293_08297 [Stachybotrys chartarum IBT 40293]
MAAARRRKMIGHRRRVEDEGEEGGPDALDVDDDSLTEGSIATDDDDAAVDSDTSNVDEVSPTVPNPRKSTNGGPKAAGRSRHRSSSNAAPSAPSNRGITDTEAMLHGLSLSDKPEPMEELDFDEAVSPPAKSPSAPVVVSSASATQQPPGDRRRQEHEDYKRRRDEDPAFVPNRGSFFMHDHRHAGPAANGFRPFGRGRGRGGRGGIGGLYTPMSHVQQTADPTTSSQWTHDMHDTVAEPAPRRPRQASQEEGPANGTGFIPTCEPNPAPINRTLSTEKHIGNAQVRVLLPDMTAPAMFPGLQVKQYTKLPDHRPPLRRDKPVRISLPDNPPRYIFPAVDRSFIFIPRALRPNQQRGRGKPRSGLGSMGGFSRRTSVFGGSYYGSMYSPSIALSRRSSFAHERDLMFSPTGSVVSRPPLPPDNNRPVVRLPPAPRPDVPMARPVDSVSHLDPYMAPDTSHNAVAPGQVYPIAPQPMPQENRPASIPMHQPRPQKNISVADIDSPTLAQGPHQSFQQAFHQQVPLHVGNGFHQETHSRHGSYPIQHSTGTPLSQIPERAIHAAPFQPNMYGQPPFYNQQPYQAPPQPGYYYGPGFAGPGMAAPATAPTFMPSGHPNMPSNYAPHNQAEPPSAQGGGPGPNLVAQEVNGMVYYYDASQLPPVNSYQPYSAPQAYQGMGAMVTPSPDGFYYPQPAPGMVYYSQ